MSKAKDGIKAYKAVSAALDDAFQRALEQEQAEGEMVLDILQSRFVIFSDHHKGNRDGADDFRSPRNGSERRRDCRSGARV